jgi:hypothetical protein
MPAGQGSNFFSTPFSPHGKGFEFGSANEGDLTNTVEVLSLLSYLLHSKVLIKLFLTALMYILVTLHTCPDISAATRSTMGLVFN